MRKVAKVRPTNGIEVIAPSLTRGTTFENTRSSLFAVAA